MTYTTEAEGFINSLQQAAMERNRFADFLVQMAGILSQAEEAGESTSGSLALRGEIKNLQHSSSRLKEGIFRLLVLGDMKRGKSTFLNAILGEDLLPRNVTACTALLTIIRYGERRKVTVFLNNGKSPIELSVEEFKRNYTLDPAVSKQMEEQGQKAFPDVDYAVVEYPLALLREGIEVVDSPGLNDTEKSDNLVTNFLHNCHAILFVLNATSAWTLGESRYLENYIKDKGFTVFFLLNRWDAIRKELLDENDLVALREKEEHVRTRFKTNLAPYTVEGGRSRYDERVFEISSLDALRRRVKNASLEDTGFPEFLGALDTFLTKERALTELRQAKVLAFQVYGHVHEAVGRRIPLLDKSLQELQASIEAVQPEFVKLEQIRNAFIGDIRKEGVSQSNDLARSFYQYLANLDQTFENDFAPYQPELKFLNFLKKGKREEFKVSLQEAFSQYLRDKIAYWSHDAEQQQRQAFNNLAEMAQEYAVSYQQVTNVITEGVLKSKDAIPSTTVIQDQPATWTRWAAGLTALAMGDIVGAGMAGTSAFNWKNVAMNISGIIAVNVLLAAVFHVTLGPLGTILTALMIGGASGEMQRRKLLKGMKDELSKSLPEIARQQAEVVRRNVLKGFNSYEEQVVSLMNEDIEAQREELENLLEQRQKHEIDREQEIQRLTSFDQNVFALVRQIESRYNTLTSGI